MSKSGWLDRASRRIDAWPVGPVAALMLGSATGFFCWAMPYSPMIGHVVIVVAPALLMFILTLAMFRWIDIREPFSILDEGDDQEDWLTRSNSEQAPPVGFDPASINIVRPQREAVRPIIIDAADAHSADQGVRDRGWPLPLVQHHSPVPVQDLAVLRDMGTGQDDEWDDDWDDQELLLDSPLAGASVDSDSREGDRHEMSIEEMMACLAFRIDGREPTSGEAPPLVHATQSAPEPAANVSNEDALRAALADLHRMAGKR